MLLALDISTSIIGWSTWHKGKIVDQGFCKLSNSKGEPKELAERLDNALDYFKKLNGITKIAAEAALQKFSGGKTTANTMNKLIAMNFGLTYVLSRHWNVPVQYISVNEARKLCGILIPRQQKGKKKDPNWTKKHVCDAVAKKYPMLTIERTKTGNVKAGFDDMADSVVIGEAVSSFL